jgi:uncharacterized membrane protein (DUF106 family)
MGLIPVLPTNIEIAMIVLAVAYTAVTVAVQRLLSNPKRMREIQAKVQVMQKEMNEMMKRNAPQEELAKKQREVMPLLGEQMKNSMKPMLIIFPLLILTYYVIIPHLPFISSDYVTKSKNFFFVVVLIVGFVAAAVILVYDRIKTKQEMKAMESSANQNQ